MRHPYFLTEFCVYLKVTTGGLTLQRLWIMKELSQNPVVNRSSHSVNVKSLKLTFTVHCDLKVSSSQGKTDENFANYFLKTKPDD